MRAIALENRLRNQLEEKIYQIPDGKTSILAINSAYSLQDAIHLEDAIKGTFAVSFIPNSNIEPELGHLDDGLRNSRRLRNLRGVVMYRRSFDLKGLATNFETKCLAYEDGEDITEPQKNEINELFTKMFYPISKLD